MATTADLPHEFDIVVVGTGLTETIVAAAFSRIGLKVLHLDRNDYYGGAYANFNLQAIETWKQKNESLAEKPAPLSESADVTDIQKLLLKEGEQAFALPQEPAHAFNIKTQFYIRERTGEEEAVLEAKKLKSRFHTSPVKLAQDPEPEQTAGNSSNVHETKEDVDKSGSENATDKHASEVNCEKVAAEMDQVKGHGNKQEQGEIGTGDGSIGADNLAGVKLTESCGDMDEKRVEDMTVAGDDSHSVVTSKSDTEIDMEITEQPESQQRQEWTVGDIKDEWRKFCFDISPKVLYSCGETVELLIQSDVARYCEFRTVSRVLTILNDNIQQVPCSRADVFSSKTVSLVEKRLMMKFLQFAADFENSPGEYQDYKGKPFVDFLKSKRLTPNILHYVQHAIAMVTDAATTVEGLKSTQMFLRSLGRYGNTAFLFPLYGTGELPQAFARLSAVFGGVYCLQMSPTHVIADSDNKCCGIIVSNGQLIRCKYLIAETSYLPSSFAWALSSRRTSRAIYITDSSILSSAEAELSLLNFNCKDDLARPVTVLELPPSACVCPQNLFVVHLTRVASNINPEMDFSEVKETLFASDTSDSKGGKPKILWSMYFTQDDRSQMTLSDTAVQNVLVVSGGGDATVGLDFCVDEAKCIFQTVCPEEDFLPKPPNPEDIIHVDDAEAAVATGPSEYEAMDGQVKVGDKEKDLENKDASTEDGGVDVVVQSVDHINIETGEDGSVLDSDVKTV